MDARALKLVVSDEILKDPYFKESKERSASYLSDLNYAVPVINEAGELFVRNYWQTCKDYLHETIINYHVGVSSHRSTAGYVAEYSLPTDHSYIAVRSTNIDKILAGIGKYLVPAEEAAGLEPTIVLNTPHKYVKVFQSDPKYFQDPPLANMLMMIIRNFWWSDKIKGKDLDGYLKRCADNYNEYHEYLGKHPLYNADGSRNEGASAFTVTKDASMLNAIYKVAPDDVYSKILSNMEELVISHDLLKKAMAKIDEKKTSIHGAFGQGSFIQGIYSKVGDATTMELLPPSRQRAWVAALGTRRGVHYDFHYDREVPKKMASQTSGTVVGADMRPGQWFTTNEVRPNIDIEALRQAHANIDEGRQFHGIDAPGWWQEPPVRALAQAQERVDHWRLVAAEEQGNNRGERAELMLRMHENRLRHLQEVINRQENLLNPRQRRILR